MLLNLLLAHYIAISRARKACVNDQQKSE